MNKKLVKPSKPQPQRLASNQNNNNNINARNNNNNKNNPKSSNNNNLTTSNNNISVKTQHKKHQSLPPQKASMASFEDDEEEEDDEEDDDEESNSDDDSMSASPLSTGNINLNDQQQQQINNQEDDNEMKYIDDEDLTTPKGQPKISERQSIESKDNKDEKNDDNDDEDDSSEDEYGISNIKPEPKSAAERTAAINNQRRKSSLLLRQTDIAMLQKYEADKNENKDEKEIENENINHSTHRNGNKSRGDKMHKIGGIEKKGNFLAVGATNMDPYLLFWNNSKKGESVVKVVQDIILMSISKDIHATHFGFGEFAILANVSNESELRRILKKVLNKVSSNVSTVKLGPVTLCAGLSMYQKGSSISQWVNECRQACRLAKTNGRGRIAN